VALQSNVTQLLRTKLGTKIQLSLLLIVISSILILIAQQAPFAQGAPYVWLPWPHDNIYNFDISFNLYYLLIIVYCQVTTHPI